MLHVITTFLCHPFSELAEVHKIILLLEIKLTEVTGCGLYKVGLFPAGTGSFLFATIMKHVLGSTQHPSVGLLGTLSGLR
jgi:hypothetical protein